MRTAIFELSSYGYKFAVLMTCPNSGLILHSFPGIDNVYPLLGNDLSEKYFWVLIYFLY